MNATVLPRTMTVADLLRAIVGCSDRQPVTIEIETEHGAVLVDLHEVVERSNCENGEVTLVLQGERR